MKSAAEIVEKVMAKFPDVTFSTLRDEASITFPQEKWPAIAKWLASDAGFAFLSDLCGVDWLDRSPRFEVVYNLLDMNESTRLRVHVPLDDDENPKIKTVTDTWSTAEWHERETFDMFGITFDGHPDLRRILMPDDWEGHPLRKDYAVGKVPVEYKHLSPGF